MPVLHPSANANITSDVTALRQSQVGLTSSHLLNYQSPDQTTKFQGLIIPVR